MKKIVDWYKNQKIKNKLIVGFLIVSILAAIVGVFGMLTIVQIKVSADEMYQKNATGLQYAGMAAMKTQSVSSTAQMISKLDITKKSTIKAHTSRMLNTMDEVEGLLANLSEVVNDELRDSTLADIISNWDYLKKYTSSFLEYMNESDDADLANSSLKLADTAASNLISTYTKLIEQVSGEASDKAAANSRQATAAMIIMGVILAAAIVISLILGYALSKNIGDPLKVMAAAGMRIAEGDVKVDDILTEKDRALSEREDEIGTLAKMVDKLVDGARIQAQEAQLVAQGDLTVDINLKSDRDLLGSSLQELVDNFHNMAQSIVRAADKVALSSDAVSNSSIVLSQGATEQASAIEQLNVTVEGISKQTELNAENAAQANLLAQRAKQNALNGNSQMKEMLSSMQEISESSRNINKVIKVIDDIAFQTNILALNAAVEAARAGQAGRGFAVVAEEVRALAARSAKAVNDTTDLIEGSIKKVTAGTKIANDTADALNEILAQVEKSAELVGAIDISSKEQAQAIEQIGQGITQVSQVVQTNAATAEESAAASEELSGQASQLKEYVAVFKLRGSAKAMTDDVVFTDDFDDFEDIPDSTEEDTGSEDMPDSIEEDTDSEDIQEIFLGAHDDADVLASVDDQEFGKY